MFARNSSAPVVPATQPPARTEPLHLMLVKTPNLTQRGRGWLERRQAQAGTFDGLELERLIRFEKLSLG
jgi:hypothetical protein